MMIRYLTGILVVFPLVACSSEDGSGRYQIRDNGYSIFDTATGCFMTLDHDESGRSNVVEKVNPIDPEDSDCNWTHPDWNSGDAVAEAAEDFEIGGDSK